MTVLKTFVNSLFIRKMSNSAATDHRSCIIEGLEMFMTNLMNEKPIPRDKGKWIL